MSTFENDLRLEEIGTGERAGTWGTATNTNLELIANALSYSATGEAIANASTHTITMADGAADEFRSFYLKCTGGGQACTVTLAPNTLSKVWMIENTTSATLTFTQGSGANVAILAGQVKVIGTDGAGSAAVVHDLMQDLAVPDLFIDDDLTLQSDAAVLGFGADKDVTLTHVADTGLLLNAAMKVQFRDAAIFIGSSGVDVLDIASDGVINLTATTDVVIPANVGLTFGTGEKIEGDSTDLTITSGAKINLTATSDVHIPVNIGLVFGDGGEHIETNNTDLTITSGGKLNLAATSDVHLANNIGMVFGDAGEKIEGDGTNLAINSSGDVNITATTVDLDGTLEVSGILTQTGNATFVGIVDITDATDATNATGDTGALRTEGGASIAKKLFVGTDLSVGGDLTIGGDDLIMATNTAGALLIADGTNFNPTTISSLSEISTAATEDTFLAIDASGGGLKKITRGTIIAGTGSSGDLAAVVEDTSPQLGGNLDVLARSITTSTSNGNIAITPNGSGVVMIDGNVGIDTGKIDLKNGGTASQILFYCESSNAHAQTLQGAPHSQGATNTLLLPDGGNGTLLSTVSTATLTNKTLTSPKINEDVAVTSTATEINLLDGVTSTTAELNILDGVTSTAAELNILDGVTSTAAELNILDGVTSTTAELNILDGVTSTAAELNILDGVTSTTAELNILDGATVVVGEINFLDLGNTAVGTAIASKAVVLDSNKDYTGIRNLTMTGTLDLATVEFNSLSGTGSVAVTDILDEDNLASDSATKLATQQSIKAYVDASSGGTLTEVLSNGNRTTTTEKIEFRDAAIFINSSADGQLDIVADTEIQIVATTIDINGAVALNGAVTGATNITLSGELDAATLDISGDIDVDGTSNLDIIDVDGAANFAADVTFAAGADILTATAGVHNTRIGLDAGIGILDGGGYNQFIGRFAGKACTTGDANTGIGDQALKSATTPEGNTAVGSSTLELCVLSQKNVAVGNAALNAHIGTTGSTLVDGLNVAVGHRSGVAVTTGIKNTLVGAFSGDGITTGNSNTAIGHDTLSATTAVTGNTAVGHNALKANTTGAQNTAVGAYAMQPATTANNCTAVGFYALVSHQTGHDNTAIGKSVMQTCTTGYNNVGVGGGDSYVAPCLVSLTSGYRNVGVGAGALASITSGAINTAMGDAALYNCTGGANTGYGAYAGLNATSGSNNTFLGHETGITGSPGGNITTASHTVCIGDENVAAAHIQVDWTVASDQRDKTDFVALDLGLDFVKALAPVTYKWDKRSKYGDKYADDYDLDAQTPDGTHKEDWLDIGFKAQEVETLEQAAGYNKSNNTNLVSSYTSDGKQMGLQYSKFVPILVKAIQEQNALIEALTARIVTLEG